MCTPVKKPEVERVHQKMWERSQIRARAVKAPMPMEACFWVIVIPEEEVRRN
jgi:hypothetical protein